MNYSDIKTFNRSVWFLILGTMFCKASYFISMPYLALRLKTALSLDPLLIGMTLGLGPLVGIVAGFYVGHLSDRLGRKAIFTLSAFVWGLTFLGFAFATEFWHFAVLNTLNGLCNSANHPVSAALISDLTEAPVRKSAFHLRYFAINVGAAFGPLLGAWLLLRDPSLGFILTSVVYLLYGVACVFTLPSESRKAKAGPSTTFAETLKALSEDTPLLLYTLASVLMGLTYCQLDSTLPQYLHATDGEEGIKLFGLLMAVNAATVVIFQLPLTRLTSKFGLLGTVKFGSLLYGFGMALLGLVARDRSTFILAMVVLTLGEILIFSNGSLIIDQIAPANRKGAYFGASGLWAVGTTIGPALGGYVLMQAGGPALFGLVGLVGIANVLVYHLGSRAQLRRRANEQNLPVFSDFKPMEPAEQS